MSNGYVTRESLIQLLANDRTRATTIGRALVVLLERQTQDEKQSNTTKHHNMRGFQPCDARFGSIHAKTYIKHGKLLDFQIEFWMEPTVHGYPRIAKYYRQLDEAAAAKAQARRNAQ